MTRTRRHLSACAAAGVIGAALAPGLAVAPAAAAPSACAAPRFGAAAAADLVRVDALDLHALGVNVGPAASVRVASTAAGTTGGPSGRSAADARYLQAKILGGTVPAGPLDAKAHQEAPPAAEAAINAATPGVNSGVLALGTGSLTAHSTWACTPPAGTVAESSVALVDAGVLPRNGRSLLHVPHNLASGASTGFVRQQGALRPQATASADLTDLTLFEGTAGQVRVRVVSQPKLTVVAGGSAAHSTVAYSAPVLQVTGPNGITHTLNSPTQHVDLAVPAGSNAAADAELAHAEGLPMLPGNPLAELLGVLPSAGPLPGAVTGALGAAQGPAAGAAGAATGAAGGVANGAATGGATGGAARAAGGATGAGNAATTGGAGRTAGTATGAGAPRLPAPVPPTTGAGVPPLAVPGIGDLPGVPALRDSHTAPGVESARTPSHAAATGAHGSIAVVRLSLGDLRKQVTNDGVRAEASSLRLQLTLRGEAHASENGYGGVEAGSSTGTVADVGVGVITAGATLPGGTGGVEGGGTGGTGALPVTGTGLALVIGSGTVLLVAGRFLTILARRRSLI